MRRPLVGVFLIIACAAERPRAPIPQIGDAGDGGAAAGARWAGAGDGGRPSDGSGGDPARPVLGAGHGGELTGGEGGRSESCDPSAETDSELAPLAQDLTLQRIAVFQAVKVPVMELGRELSSRPTQLVGGRAALFRAYLKTNDDWSAREIRARLTLRSDATAEPWVLDQKRIVDRDSSDEDLSSTFNFEVPAELMTEDVAYSVELLESGSCAPGPSSNAGARFPESGELLFGVAPALKLRIVVVPVVTGPSGSQLAPVTTPEQLTLLRRDVLRMFPISELDLTVREEALSTEADTMLEVLDQVAALRELENGDPGVSYYGLVRFTETREEYCNPSCVLGASFNGETPTAGVGVGVGFAGDEAASTFAHELGHVYGRPHTPCGVSGDPAYPYSGGRIGSWGYDVQEKVLFDPLSANDFMSYCKPVWVSDYTYERLRSFIAEVPGARTAAEALARQERPAESEVYVSILRQGGKAPIWGQRRPLGRETLRHAVVARVLRSNGSPGRSANIIRHQIPDLKAEIIYVPQWVAELGARTLGVGSETISLPGSVTAVPLQYGVQP